MICLRCGYCCLNYLVVVVKDPNIGIANDNFIALDGTKRCPHLEGNEPGKYSCKIHEYDWFKDTPCSEHGQIETQACNLCRVGEYKLKNMKNQS